jgi:uncharacterized protein YggE
MTTANSDENNPKYGILKVSGEAKTLVAATHAFLHLRLEAEHFFFGNAALEKSRELRELVQQLLQLGISDSEINIVDVQAKLQNGTLVRGSKVMYRLKVELNQLSRFGEVFGAVSNQRGVALERIEWGYQLDAVRLELLKNAMQQAQARAQAMAGAVGHVLAGVRACSDSAQMPQHDVWLNQDSYKSAPQAMMRQKTPAIELGTSLSQRLELSVVVNVEFWVTKTPTTP